MEKDTIHLKEVLIEKGKPRYYYKKIKFSNNKSLNDDMLRADEEVTLVDSLPSGYLQSLTLYVNWFMDSKRKDSFKDTNFQIVLYKANPDNTPGERLLYEPVAFTIYHNEKGRKIIDLTACKGEVSGPVFIGIKKVSETAPGDFALLSVLSDEKKKFVSYARVKGKWYPARASLKMKLIVKCIKR